MKVQLRRALAGAVALAVAGLGLPWGTQVAYAAETPVLTSVWLDAGAGATTAVDEGRTFSVKGTFTDGDADNHYALIQLGSTFVETMSGIPFGARTFSVARLYTDDNPTGTPQDPFTLTVKVMDGAGAVSNTWTMTVNVRNVAPTVSGLTLSPASILERETVQASGTFADPGTKDTFTLSLHWGDGSTPYTRSYSSADAKTFAAAHQYTAAGSYTVTATVTDDDGGAGKQEALLNVGSRNRPPADLVLSGTGAIEGDPATIAGHFADPDAADTHAVQIQWGDGTQSDVALGAGLLEFSAAHSFASHGTYTVTVTVADPAPTTLVGSTTLTVTRRNHAPADLVLSTSGAVEGGSGALTFSFTDADPLDRHWVSLSWGDGSSVAYSVLDAGARTYDGSHVYALAGTYTVTVVVTDANGGSVSGTVPFVVRTRSVAELVADLGALVQSWDLPQGHENRLAANVWVTHTEYEWGKSNLCQSLAALGNHVNAQTDKTISVDQAGSFWSLISGMHSTVDCQQLRNAEEKAADLKPGHGAGGASATNEKDKDKKEK